MTRPQDAADRAQRKNKLIDLTRFGVHQNIFCVDEIHEMNKSRVEKALNYTHAVTLPRTDNLYYHRKVDLNSLLKVKKTKE